MRIKVGQIKQKRPSAWDKLTKRQKKNRLFVYSIIGLFYICGIISFFTNTIPLGIILVILPSIALYILAKIPDYILRSYCQKAEYEYQLHKNDKNPDRIYLNGEQMYHFLKGDIIDLKDGKTKPFSYKSVMSAKDREEHKS